MSWSSWSKRATLMTAVAAAFVAAAGWPGAAAGAATQQVAVTADFHDPGQPGFSNYAPACGPEQPEVCSFGFDGRVDWTGGMRGSSVYHAIGYGTPSGELRWEVWETFTGTVTGCGTGTLSWHGAGSLDVARLDPATQTVPMEGTLDVGEPTSGDLAGTVGRLELVDTAMRLAPAFGEQHGHVTGELSCARGPAVATSTTSHDDGGDRAAVLAGRRERTDVDPAVGTSGDSHAGRGSASAVSGSSRSLGGTGLAVTGHTAAPLFALGLLLVVSGATVRPVLGPSPPLR